MWIYCNDPKYAINIGRAVAFKIDEAFYWETQGIKNTKGNRYVVSAYIEGESWYICSAESEEKAEEIIIKLAKGTTEKWTIE